MTQAGWYPDPAGQPQTYRYWDGTSWSEDTTGDPYAPPPSGHGAPPPPPAAPPPPATPPPAPPQGATVLAPGGSATGYGAVPPPPPGPPPGAALGQQPYGGGYPSGPGGSAGGGSGRTVALVVAAVVGFVLLAVIGFVGFRVLTDDDGDASASDGGGEPTTGEPTEPSSPDLTSPTSPTSPGSSAPTAQQCKGGLPSPSVTPRDGATKVSGGGLTIPVPEGYAADTSYSTVFTFADDFTPVQKVIEQNDQTGWVSIYGVGALRRANGFDDVAQAAEVVMTCMASSPDLYADFTGRDDVSSGAIEVDGKDAYQVTADLHVDDPALDVEGDVAQVIVVDTGDAETFGLFVTVVPIGDDDLIAQQAAFPEEIKVR